MSPWCTCLFCIGWLGNVQRFITRAEPLYDSFNPLFCDVFAAVVVCARSISAVVVYKSHDVNLSVFCFLLYLWFRDVRAKIFLHRSFSENFTIERWWVSDVRNVKKMGVTDFVLERTCPEEHLNLNKSGFVSEEGHNDCKSQNIAIRSLKGNILYQIWFKWTY